MKRDPYAVVDSYLNISQAILQLVSIPRPQRWNLTPLHQCLSHTQSLPDVISKYEQQCKTTFCWLHPSWFSPGYETPSSGLLLPWGMPSDSRGPRAITAEQLSSWSASAFTLASKTQHFTSIFMGFLTDNCLCRSPKFYYVDLFINILYLLQARRERNLHHYSDY